MITIAKQKNPQKYIFKLHSSVLKQSNWNLDLSLEEAISNETDLVSLSDSQVLQFIDEYRGVDSKAKALEIKRKIKELKFKENNEANRIKTQRLYHELYQTQFQPDYMCLVMDSKSDYKRANKGFTINGIKYHRFLGTNGGIKNSTIVYVNEEIYPWLKERLDCGRNKDVPLVPAKLEAYQALICSGSIPVSMPKGIIVVPDSITHFKEDILQITDEDEEPTITEIKDADIELDNSDGFGLMTPELSKRWNIELGMADEGEYLSGVNVRGLPWTKGMLFPFDFVKFGEEIAHTYEIKDVWGDTRDIREAEVILTESMLKCWNCYSSWEDYWNNVVKYHYGFRIAKTAPHIVDEERQTNYQFLQSYYLSDEQIAELVKPTVDEINDVMGMDYRKALLFLRGTYMNKRNVLDSEYNFVKGLMIEPELINDPYVRHSIRTMITKRINDAKKGVLNVHGNFAIIGGDPYMLCESMFGLEQKGLLKAGECYHKFWSDKGVDKVVCFRAPMTY